MDDARKAIPTTDPQDVKNNVFMAGLKKRCSRKDAQAQEGCFTREYTQLISARLIHAAAMVHVLWDVQREGLLCLVNF